MERKYSILIVDDDKFLLDMYRKKFEKRGSVVEVAVGPEDALGKLRGGAVFNILLLDIIMPGMNGIELLEIIRNENLVPDAIVIMLTNESDQEKIESAKKLGAKGYIVKATSVPTEVAEETLKIADINIKN